MEDTSSEVAIPDNTTLETVADGAIVTTAETTVVTRQDPSLPRVVIGGGDFPHSKIGETIQNQSITKQKLINCTIINKYFISGGAYGYHPPCTGALDREGVAVAGLKEPLALPQCSSTKIVENSGDDDYTYLENDVKIQRHPLRKGTKVFRGRQIHPCSSGGEDAWRNVAIKIVHASHNSDKEVRRLIKLDEHHNIVKILQSGKTPGPTEEIFMVMELCSKNLSEYVAEHHSNPPSFKKKATFTKQLISGLQFIHENEIVHGDLKPDNILLSMSGKYLKISDFGMSKDVHEGQSKSSESGAGTDGFRAPELYVPGSAASCKSDMFSFGIITFYLFTDGKHPYGDDPNDWSYNIRKNTENPSLIGVPSSIDTGTDQSQLLQILQSLLEAKPAFRPTSEEVKSHSFFKGVNIDVENIKEKLKRVAHPEEKLDVAKKFRTGINRLCPKQMQNRSKPLAGCEGFVDKRQPLCSPPTFLKSIPLLECNTSSPPPHTSSGLHATSSLDFQSQQSKEWYMTDSLEHTPMRGMIPPMMQLQPNPGSQCESEAKEALFMSLEMSVNEPDNSRFQRQNSDGIQHPNMRASMMAQEAVQFSGNKFAANISLKQKFRMNLMRQHLNSNPPTTTQQMPTNNTNIRSRHIQGLSQDGQSPTQEAPQHEPPRLFHPPARDAKQIELDNLVRKTPSRLRLDDNDRFMEEFENSRRRSKPGASEEDTRINYLSLRNHVSYENCTFIGDKSTLNRHWKSEGSATASRRSELSDVSTNRTRSEPSQPYATSPDEL